MKIIVKFLSLMIIAGLLWTCDDNVELTDVVLKSGKPEVDKPGADKTGDVTMVVKPFKAHFYTKRDYSREAEGPGICTSDDFPSFNFQVGEGEATHLGYFTTKMQFCVGAGGTYNYIQGAMVAANGDSLFISSTEGGVVNVWPPGEGEGSYDAWFKDPFIFTGGTGRFEGASGGGMTDSKVDLFYDDNWGVVIPDHQTDHIWTGTLILPKK